MRLTETEKDRLKDLYHNGTMRIVWKYVEMFVEDREAALIAFSYRPGKEQELQVLKAEAQGARRVLNNLKKGLDK